MAENPDDAFVAPDDFAYDPYDPDAEVQAAANDARASKVKEKDITALLRRRQEAYTRLFQGAAIGDDAEIVRADLARFCRADRTTFHQDDRIHCLFAGRNEVYQRIIDHMRLDFDTLLIKYSIIPPQ